MERISYSQLMEAISDRGRHDLPEPKDVEVCLNKSGKRYYKYTVSTSRSVAMARGDDSLVLPINVKSLAEVAMGVAKVEAGCLNNQFSNLLVKRATDAVQHLTAVASAHDTTAIVRGK